MKRFYVVFTAKTSGKNWAGVMDVAEGSNIIDIAHAAPGMTAAHICASKSTAEQKAAEWNAAYKRNGTALF